MIARAWAAAIVQVDGVRDRAVHTSDRVRPVCPCIPCCAGRGSFCHIQAMIARSSRGRAGTSDLLWL